MDKLSLLLEYADKGMKIFPCWEMHDSDGSWVCSCSAGSKCNSPGKHPRVTSWTSEATSSADQIKKWHIAHPDANWAWKLENHWALDFDPRNEGNEPYDFWEAYAGFEIPKTLRQRTGGEGWHVIFKQRADREQIGSDRKLFFPGQTRPVKGVDVKGIGGYIVIAPSNHYERRSYAWANWGTRPTVPPVALWDEDMLRQRSSSSSAGDGGGGSYDLKQLFETGVPLGEQNHQLYAFLCSLRTKDAPRQEMIEFGLQAMSKFENDPGREPWTDKDIIAMVDRIRERWDAGYSDEFRGLTDIPDESMRWARGTITPEIKEQAAEHHDQTVEDSEYDKEVARAQRRMHINDDARLRFNTVKSSRLYVDPANDPESDSLAAILEMPPRHVVPRIQGMLNVEHNAVIAAAYKTGKTTLACNLAKALVDNEDFLGRKTFLEDGECVLHLNGEMSRDDLANYYRGLGIKNVERVKLVNFRDKPLPLMDDTAFENFVEYCIDRWITVVIVDSWRRLCGWSGLNENWNHDVERLTTRIDEFKRKTEAPTFIAIAHQGRKEHIEGEEHARGATALDDWADARWLLTRGTEGDQQRYLTVTGRDVEMLETGLVFNSETRVIGLGQGTRSENKGMAGIDDIVRIVTEQPGITTNVLKKAIDDCGAVKGTAAIANAIKRAIRDGHIHVVPGANRMQHHHPGPGAAAQWAQNPGGDWNPPSDL